MNLSKELKRKRDSEKRLEQSSPTKIMIINSSGESEYIDLSQFLKKAVVKLNGLQGNITLTEGDNITLEVINNNIKISSTGGSGGASSFIDLSDTPITYEGQQGKFLRVSSSEDALEFITVTLGEGIDAESILTKPISIPSFTGKDGYVLAYNENLGEFYLKQDEGGGGGGNSGFGEYGFIEIPISITSFNVL